MKKTTFILGLSLSAILAIAGCANNTTNDQAVIDKLSIGLDRVTNAVSQVSVANIDEISREDFGGVQFTSQTTLSGARQPATAIAKNIESNRYQILRKAKALKKAISNGELKLGNENARAISELTTSMQKYATELTRTKSDYRNTVRSMAKLENADTRFNAKLTRLSCCLESRDCYMNNILNSLNNVESILDALNNGSENTTENATENDTENSEPNYQSTKDWGNKTPDDYSNTNNQNANNQSYNFTPNFNLPQNYNSVPYGFNCPDGNCYPNTYCPDGNCYNLPSNCENGVCYNNVAGVNGYGFNRGIFNPTRNTDTYGPGVTNIDTYRMTGNGAGYGYGFNGQGKRHFNGSNGVNNIMPNDNFDSHNEEALQNDVVEASDINKATETKVDETADEKKIEDEVVDTHNVQSPKNEREIKSAAENNGEKKIVFSSEQSHGTTKPQPKKAETLEIETESKVKTVSTAPIAEKVSDNSTENNSVDEKVSDNSTENDAIKGEDKVKGHTSVTQADINEDIKQLLK